MQPSMAGASRPRGELTLAVLPQRWPLELTWRVIARHGLPRRGLAPGVARWRLRNLPHLWRGAWRLAVAQVVRRLTGHPYVLGTLYLDLLHADGRRTPLGLASLRLVTTAGVNRIVDGLQSSGTDLSLWKFHAFGTGTNAEATGDTALQTEETTQYNPDNTRPTGSQTENGANVYRTVGTYSPDSGGTRAITEHGILTQAATGGGTLLDRSQFSAVNLVAGADSLQATYDFTINAGG